MTTAKHRDVSEDDYPTGPIDVWPLLAADAPAEAFIVDDNGAAHDTRTGRFTKKGKVMARKVWTWADVKDMVCGPEQANVPGPNIFQWPDEPGVEWVTTRLADGVTSSRPLNSNNHVSLPPRERKPIPPDPATIRAWAQRSGYPVNSRGKLPQAVIDAYVKARAAQ